MKIYVVMYETDNAPTSVDLFLRVEPALFHAKEWIRNQAEGEDVEEYSGDHIYSAHCEEAEASISVFERDVYA